MKKYAGCQAVGFSKTDARGRVVDIHALRTTFGTPLAVAGVHPRVAQTASRIQLKTNFYTDLALPDVNGAINARPHFVGEQSCNGRFVFQDILVWDYRVFVVFLMKLIALDLGLGRSDSKDTSSGVISVIGL